MSVLALTSLGCGVGPGIFADGGSSGSDSGSGSEQPDSAPPDYNSNAMGEVVGTNCRYEEKVQQIKYDLSIQNSSADHAFKYAISIAFTGGDSEFADDSLGSQFKEVTVAAGKDRTITITQSHSSAKRFWYGCTVKNATKSLAD